MAHWLGVDWAPLSVPFARRLQTFCILMSVLSFTVSPLLGVVLVLYALTTRLWFVSAGYILWIIYDTYILKTPSRGGRRSDMMRNSFFGRSIRDYFPVSLVKTADLGPDRNYIMGYHPHGIIGFGALCNFGTEATGFSHKYPGIKPHVLTLEVNFRLPIMRGFILWSGICDVSRESIEWIVTRQGLGNAAVIVIGGAAEALNAKPGNYDITLKNRKGFVRIALQTGSALVPVFSFGENDLYQQADNPQGSHLRHFQDTFKKYLGVSPPLFYGRGVFNYNLGLLPFRKPITAVVGAPIEVPRDPTPSRDLVDEYHRKYMESLSRLFDEHKSKYGVDENKRLNFV